MRTKTETQDIQMYAEKITKGAGDILMDYYDKKREHTYKIGRDFVTDADLASEKYLIQKITEKYPDHNIFSEEAGGDFSHDSDWTWTLDPLDGTRTYKYKLGMHGFWGINVTVEYKDDPVVGVVYKPKQELYLSASKDNGFTKQDHSNIGVSPTTELEKSFVAIRDPKIQSGRDYLKRYNKLHNALVMNTYRTWGAHEMPVYGYYVISGFSDGYILPATKKGSYTVKWWDIGPMIVMVREAGGKASDFYGNPVNRNDLENGVVISNGKIHNQLLELIKTNYGS